MNSTLIPRFVFACCLIMSGDMPAGEPFRIEIVDDETGWPVPLVELRTTHNVCFVSDNAGVIAFDSPELMNQQTWLHVKGHGYSVPTDRFGYSGFRVVPKRGESLTVKVHRELPAKRLGRITGAGIFAESQKFGEELDWKGQKILGCDSVQNVIHNGKLYWGWGDTVLANYPLGRFHMIGATTELQPLKSFRPPIRLRYDYFVDDKNVPRNVAQMPGSGPTWLSGYVSLPDADGKLHLCATYVKIQPPLSVYETGLCVWNEDENRFDRHFVIWERSSENPKPPPAPHGHPIRWTAQDGQEWILFGDPFPNLKCRATLESWANPDEWQTLKPQEFVKAVDSDEEIKPHRGAIAWNGFRNKWVTVFTQLNGDSSRLGELWYAEADAPTGPWSGAIKVVTHDKYTFYNPQLHLGFTPDDSPILLFEATYTHTFSKTQTATSRHDYNQILYRLDLDEFVD